VAPQDIEIEVGRQDAEAVARLLRALPDWFGIEESNLEYIESARTLPTVLALDAGRVVGALLWRRHFAESAEIHLMAVDPAYHRTGVGSLLLDRAEDALRSDGVRYLQVKTQGPSWPDEGYEKTRLFYQARGFVPLEEIVDFWPEDPMLLLVKAL
jgi:GNAT superfamily N-acetyltransferase